MNEPLILNIEQTAALLGVTVPSIRGHIRRGNYSAIPRPFKRGPRLWAWRRADVIKWVEGKKR